MRPSWTSMLALSAAANALDLSSRSDADDSAWKARDGVISRSSTSRVSNRPSKRQDGWNPPSELATPLQEVWAHCLDTYTDGLFGFQNFGWDQIMATNGTLNMCVRWESSSTATKNQRDQIASVVSAQYQQWFEWLYGFDNFPFSNIAVNVVGWAVTDASLLEGSTDDIQVYTNLDSEGAPECDPGCGRFFHHDGDYSACAAGADRHYDQSLWLTDGFEGGAGGDWGQRLGREYFLEALSREHLHILLHEQGHSFGLDDFYDWTPTGITNFIMLAGSATEITDFDGWMLRNWWYELSRNRGWQ